MLRSGLVADVYFESMNRVVTMGLDSFTRPAFASLVDSLECFVREDDGGLVPEIDTNVLVHAYVGRAWLDDFARRLNAGDPDAVAALMHVSAPGPERPTPTPSSAPRAHDTHHKGADPVPAGRDSFPPFLNDEVW